MSNAAKIVVIAVAVAAAAWTLVDKARRERDTRAREIRQAWEWGHAYGVAECRR